MRSYFFLVTHDGPPVERVIAVELPNREKAWSEATRACGEIIRDLDGKLAGGAQWTMDVSDSDGLLFQISFRADTFR